VTFSIDSPGLEVASSQAVQGDASQPGDDIPCNAGRFSTVHAQESAMGFTQERRTCSKGLVGGGIWKTESEVAARWSPLRPGRLALATASDPGGTMTGNAEMRPPTAYPSY
jgi:hypothetical protein